MLRRRRRGNRAGRALAVLDPLPPIDIDEFSKRLEVIFWQDLYAFKSKHAEWWERTSAKIWIGFLALAREYGPMLALSGLVVLASWRGARRWIPLFCLVAAVAGAPA